MFVQSCSGLALGFEDLFAPASAGARALVNDGLAALAWVGLSALVTTLIRQLALPLPTRTLEVALSLPLRSRSGRSPRDVNASLSTAAQSPQVQGTRPVRGAGPWQSVTQARTAAAGTPVSRWSGG